MNRKFISPLFLVVSEVLIIDTGSRKVFVIAETKYLHFATSVNMVKCLITVFDTVLKALMNLFSVFVKFTVSNGRHGKEETCEELVREVEGNGVFSQLSLEVRRKMSKSMERSINCSG